MELFYFFGQDVGALNVSGFGVFSSPRLKDDTRSAVFLVLF